MRLLALAACLILASCGVKEIVRELDPFEVKVPVYQPCKVNLVVTDYERRVKEDGYADSAAAMLAAPDIDAQTKLRLAGRFERTADLLELVAALKGCTTPPPAR